MQGKYEALFKPMKVGNVTIKNRVVLCAMGGTSPFGMNGLFNEGIREYYLERAKANVGLIIPGVTGVKNMMGDGYLYEKEDIFMGPVKSLMDELHSFFYSI